MNILTMPLWEAIIVLAKVTFLIFWGGVMAGYVVRIILNSIFKEIAEYRYLDSWKNLEKREVK